jgi:hypothetical protein
VHEEQLDIPAGATEGECLTLVQQRQDPPAADWFGRVTRSWLLAAYAHQSPPAPLVETLCREWHSAFRGAA